MLDIIFALSVIGLPVLFIVGFIALIVYGFWEGRQNHLRNEESWKFSTLLYAWDRALESEKVDEIHVGYLDRNMDDREKESVDRVRESKGFSPLFH